MALPNLTFSVASEYDGKGLGKARKDVNAFSKNIKNLARTVGVSLSAAALVQFGKSSVKAFSDAQREGVVLTNTMKNLGLAFATPQVEAYINSIGRLYGVTGEQAVPAMQALVTATGSVSKSQQLMNTALNISAQTGIGVTEVAKGLSQAYLGNRKALNAYNTGLTKTELQTISFTDLQLRLDKIFAGSATAAAATYSGQMLILAENAEQAKEVIGKGLVDSFVLLAGEGGLPSATTAMQDFATATAEATLGAASLIDKLQQKLSPGGFNFLGLVPVIGGYIGPGGVLDKLRAEGRKVATQNMGAPGAISGKSLTGAAYFAAQKKADAEALKTANRMKKIEQDRLNNLKRIATEAAKKLALDKASAFLNQANKLFDIDRIQLTAAAMAKQTEEDYVRIRLKTNILELEDAIADGNVQGAAKFASLISEDARLLGVLRDNAFALSDVPNPFDAWMASLQAALAALLAITNYVPTVTKAGGFMPQGPSSTFYTPGAMASQAANAEHFASLFNYDNSRTPSSNEFLFPRMAAGGVVTDPTMALIGEAGPEAVIPLNRMGSMGGTYVTVNVAGSVSTERDLVDAITQGIYNNQAAGIPINYSTVY
jgi:hypothetical protein